MTCDKMRSEKLWGTYLVSRLLFAFNRKEIAILERYVLELC